MWLKIAGIVLLNLAACKSRLQVQGENGLQSDEELFQPILIKLPPPATETTKSGNLTTIKKTWYEPDTIGFVTARHVAVNLDLHTSTRIEHADNPDSSEDSKSENGKAVVIDLASGATTLEFVGSVTSEFSDSVGGKEFYRAHIAINNDQITDLDIERLRMESGENDELKVQSLKTYDLDIAKIMSSCTFGAHSSGFLSVHNGQFFRFDSSLGMSQPIGTFPSKEFFELLCRYDNNTKRYIVGVKASDEDRERLNLYRLQNGALSILKSWTRPQLDGLFVAETVFRLKAEKAIQFFSIGEHSKPEEAVKLLTQVREQKTSKTFASDDDQGHFQVVNSKLISNFDFSQPLASEIPGESWQWFKWDETGRYALVRRGTESDYSYALASLKTLASLTMNRQSVIGDQFKIADLHNSFQTYLNVANNYEQSKSVLFRSLEELRRPTYTFDKVLVDTKIRELGNESYTVRKNAEMQLTNAMNPAVVGYLRQLLANDLALKELNTQQVTTLEYFTKGHENEEFIQPNTAFGILIFLDFISEHAKTPREDFLTIQALKLKVKWLDDEVSVRLANL